MISPLSPAPRDSDGENYPFVAEAFADSLVVFAAQAEDARVEINAREASAAAASVSAAAAATLASQLQAAAVAAANYKGLWTALAGALAIPASVMHAGALWMLLSNVANVTTAEPGVSASWRQIPSTGGTEPDQQPPNRALGSAAYIWISRVDVQGVTGLASFIAAGAVGTVTATVPGIGAGDHILSVSPSVALPAGVYLLPPKWVTGNDWLVPYFNSSGSSATPSAHTLAIRAERQIPE